MRFDLGDSQLSRVFFSSNSLQSARHSPRTEPFIPIPNSTMTTNAIPRCPITRHATCRRPAARAPGAKAGKHPTLGNHRRPSLDWPTRRPGRPMAPRHSLLGLLLTQSTGPRARAAPGHSGLRGFCCSSSSLAAPPLRQCARPPTIARALSSYHTHQLQRLPMQSQCVGKPRGEHAAKKVRFAGTLAGGASLLSLSRRARSALALKRGIRTFDCALDSLRKSPCPIEPMAKGWGRLG